MQKIVNIIKPKVDFYVDHIIIGGGVIGLAIASKLSKIPKTHTLLLERNRRCGEETSSRNSEVIHAGIYYPPDSLKTRLCIEGNKKLYKLCEQVGIPHKKIGKWIVAQDDDEAEYLCKMKLKADLLGVPLHFLSTKEFQEMEPNIHAKAVLVSPSTGILDTHSYLLYLECEIQKAGGDVVLNTNVTNIDQLDNGEYIVYTKDAAIQTRVVVNSAGLYADDIHSMLLKRKSPYTIYPLKGQYFSYSGKPLVERLIYPCPPSNIQILGIHVTLSLDGRMKFGPDSEDHYEMNKLNYKIDESEERRMKFYNAIKRYLPNIDINKLQPDYTGIRPKLSKPGEPFRDFIIQEEKDDGFNNFINLVGIESPGLTASLAIADYVATLIKH